MQEWYYSSENCHLPLKPTITWVFLDQSSPEKYCVKNMGKMGWQQSASEDHDECRRDTKNALKFTDLFTIKAFMARHLKDNAETAAMYVS